MHRASGREQSRLRLALLNDLDPASARQLLEVYPHFHLIEDPSGTTWSLLAAAAGDTGTPGPVGGSTYLIDPLGHIMMHYAAGYDPNDLKKDLKRLLTWSKMDEQ